MPDETHVDGVILAAGMSSRAGAFKPSLPIGGKPIIAHCIEGMQRFCRRIIVVGGHEIGQLRGLVDGYDGVDCIENPSYRRGMFTSVKTGLAAVKGDRCFLLPADIPLVPPRVYRALLAVEAEVVLPVFRGRKGHPVCLSKSAISRILAEPDDATLRDVIGAIGYSVKEVDAAEILLDVDTPEDYESIRQRFV